MSADQRRDGDNAQLPVRGLSDESRLRDALDRKIADAVHRLPMPVPPAERGAA